MPAKRTTPIVVMATASDGGEDGEWVPLFIGREDGTIEKYVSAEDADLGFPSLIARGHRGPVTGLVATSADEVYSCSLDGSVKRWELTIGSSAPATGSALTARSVREAEEGGGGRVLQSFEGTVPLHCLTIAPGGGARLYAGGADGALHVVDGSRRSYWPGHSEPIRCVAITAEGFIVTGGADQQILVWDPEKGRPFRLLVGHTDAVTSLAVVPPAGDAAGEDEAQDAPGAANVTDRALLGTMGRAEFAASPSNGAIVSFSRDGTARVWPVPNPIDDEETAAAEADGDGADDAVDSPAARRLSSSLPSGDDGAVDDADGPTAGDRKDAARVSFGDGAEAAAARRASGAHVSFNEPAADAKAAEAAAADGDGGGDGGAMPPADPADAIFNSVPANVRSVLKAPEQLKVRRMEAVGTIALPAVPLSVYQPPETLLPAEEVEAIGAGGAASGVVYVGSLEGCVWGLQLAVMARAALRYVADGRRRVLRELRSAEKLLAKSTALASKECRRDVKAETAKQLRVAAKAAAAKRAAEKQQRAEERRAAAAARRQQAAAEERDGSEGEAEEEEEEEADEADDEEEAEADGDQEEIAQEDEQSGGDPLSALSPDQRTALDAFVQSRKAACEEKVAALRTAVEQHLAQVRPLAQSTYHSAAHEFARRKYTSVALVSLTASPAQRVDLPQRAHAKAEAVSALVESRGVVYAAQGTRVGTSRLTPGVVSL